MSCSEGRRPSRIPRPHPVGSLIEAGHNTALSPHSPLARGSKIPRLVRTTDAGTSLNESFSIPQRHSRTLSPRMPPPPPGIDGTPVMRTAPSRFSDAGRSERAPRKAASSPRRLKMKDSRHQQRRATVSPRIPNWAAPETQNEDGSPICRPTDGRQDVNKRLDMSDAVEEDFGPDDVDLDTSYDTYHSAMEGSDVSTDDDEFELADNLDDEPVRRGPSGRRQWQKPPQEEYRITAGCLPTWGQRLVDVANEHEANSALPKRGHDEMTSGTSGEQSPCLDRQERTGVSCSLQNEGPAGGGAYEAAVEEEEDMWAAWEDPGVYHMGIAPGETADDYERRHQDLIDSFLYPQPTLKQNMRGCPLNPKLGEKPVNFLRRCRQAEAEYAARAPPGEYTVGKRPEESWEEYEQRHLDLIDRFRFPQPRLKPNMRGCRVNPEPGETPLEFIRRNRQAEEEYAAVAPPEVYIYGRRPEETWDDYDRRSQQLIEKHWQAVQRNPWPPAETSQGFQPPPVRRPSPPRPRTSQPRPGPSHPRRGRSGVDGCVPSNVAALIHGYGDI